MIIITVVIIIIIVNRGIYLQFKAIFWIPLNIGIRDLRYYVFREILIAQIPADWEIVCDSSL